MTALIVGTPYLLFGYHNASLQLVLGTLDACVALLVSYLVYGRYVRRRLTQDLLLAQGLLLLAVAGTISVALNLLGGARPEPLEVWLPLALRTAGALLIAAASLVGSGHVQLTHGRLRLSPLVSVAAVCLMLVVWRDALPVALSSSAPAAATRPMITGHPLLLVSQAVAAVSFMVASVAFTRRAMRRHDELLRWLGPACALAAFARVNYVLFPSLYSDWFYTGDLLRTTGYLILLVGAAREIGQYWSARARAAVLEDRRRLARELHDGVVQELSYIRAEAHTVGSGDEVAERILSACDRGLDEARAAVDALGRGGDEPLAYVLHRAAQQVAERYDAHLDVDLDDSVQAAPEQRHALVRIAREAVSNAVRHGGADRVSLRLVRDQDGSRLLVEDDGKGFDVVSVSRRASGYGLVSMRERALALPGSFEIESIPERGTTVGVSW
ncbi:MAG TPA: ATP-binding protein [Nocardioidaceae bacterium]|nr:ATP-binding protein [Nocardioidaceae bacterium]